MTSSAPGHEGTRALPEPHNNPAGRPADGRSGPSPAPPGARAALTANNHPQRTQTLEDNLAAATAINAATQEAVDLVHNETSRTRFDVPEPAPGS